MVERNAAVQARNAAQQAMVEMANRVLQHGQLERRRLAVSARELVAVTHASTAEAFEALINGSPAGGLSGAGGAGESGAEAGDAA